MEHSFKFRLVNALIMNIPVAATISLVAQYLAIHTIILPLFLINFVIAYIVSTLVGVFIPAVKWGFGFAMACKAQPDTLKFGLCINAVVNLVYVVCNSIVLTYFNVVIMNHAPVIAVLFGILETFIPIYIVGFIVSFIANRPAENIAKSIVKE